MIIFLIAVFIKASLAIEYGATPFLAHIDQLPGVAAFDDAHHRGPGWYDDSSSSDTSKGSEVLSSSSSDSSSESSSTESSSESSSASSFETREKKMVTKVHRVCTPCPDDMMKKFKNRGIKWICGGYQRARRSFKSECMMRYRNCEEGTLFVKLYASKCKEDKYHGRSFFYIYKT